MSTTTRCSFLTDSEREGPVAGRRYALDCWWLQTLTNKTSRSMTENAHWVSVVMIVAASLAVGQTGGRRMAGFLVRRGIPRTAPTSRLDLPPRLATSPHS